MHSVLLILWVMVLQIEANHACALLIIHYLVMCEA